MKFDMAGGSRAKAEQVPSGRVGLRRATSFDLVNAAERIYLALEPNADHYGARSDVALH